MAGATVGALANYACGVPRLYPESRTLSQLCVLHSECVLLEESAADVLRGRHPSRLALRTVIGTLASAIGTATVDACADVLAHSAAEGGGRGALTDALLEPLGEAVVHAHPATRAFALESAAAAAIRTLAGALPKRARASDGARLASDAAAVCEWASAAACALTRERVAAALAPARRRAEDVAASL